MAERRGAHRVRTLRSGKIIFNYRGSILDCVVRNLSDEGACLQMQSTAQVPENFELLLDGETTPRECHQVWQAGGRVGVAFDHPMSKLKAEAERAPQPREATMLSGWQRTNERGEAERVNPDLLRSEMLRLRAALDEVSFGVVLLDAELRAQFINRAFRRMWRLPDAKADSKPPFVALMYHGRDTRAYAIPAEELDAYVAERVAHVKAGHPAPLDLRLANGEVLRFQCMVLPGGGRMLSYTYVTDIVRHADELEFLRAALDNLEQGVVLLDCNLTVQFMNRVVRKFWNVSDEVIDSKPTYADLVNESLVASVQGVAPEQLRSYIAQRIEAVRKGNPGTADFRIKDGRIIRSQCTALPNGNRMLTYTDVTDLVSRADQLEHLATVDALTGLLNRRRFSELADAEWSRFQRYNRPLSLMIVDIDHFKDINDHFGHDVGDRSLVHLADICREDRRGSDIIARVGGEEFVMLLPETDSAQAGAVAERLRQRVADSPAKVDGQTIKMTVSVGVAEATQSMSGIGALMKVADHALYEAKARGRNRTIHAGAPPTTELYIAAE